MSLSINLCYLIIDIDIRVIVLENLASNDKIISTKALVTTALFGVISYLIMFIEINLPFMPYFLKLDLSDIPALLAGFSHGPLMGVAVVFLKNFFHVFSTATMGIGELTNFLVSGSYVVVASYLFYKRKFSLNSSLFVGMAIMTISAVVINLMVVIPLYETVLDLPLSKTIEMVGEINPLVNGLASYIAFVLIPFNLIKGIVLFFAMMMVFPKIQSYKYLWR